MKLRVLNGSWAIAALPIDDFYPLFSAVSVYFVLVNLILFQWVSLVYGLVGFWSVKDAGTFSSVGHRFRSAVRTSTSRCSFDFL